MRTADYPEVPDDFGHWLAGFIDGEGCFSLVYDERRPGARTLKLRFSLGLRDDDSALMEEIVARTGLGRLTAERVYPSCHVNAKPQVRWSVTDRAGIGRLVELLDRYPLRSKKARDYAIWREAVTVWTGMQRPRRRGSGGSTRYDWTALALLRGRLMAARAYEQPADIDAEPPGAPQLWAE